MEIKDRHKKIIEKQLFGKFKSFQIEKLKTFPKSIKFHIHLIDGWTASYYNYMITGLKTDESKMKLYCRLSPMIFELIYNVTFWTEGEKWMERYKIDT